MKFHCSFKSHFGHVNANMTVEQNLVSELHRHKTNLRMANRTNHACVHLNECSTRSRCQFDLTKKKKKLSLMPWKTGATQLLI